ncbi:MAG: efflux RND transporter permease subunit [Planctomycetes bacterium]|nr:efflux RND transporter permease subunit [Planctomycetota bacterium]
MIISNYAVEKRITVFALTAVIILSGLISYHNLPLESAPDVTIPNVFVQTVYRGVSPEDIEKSITIEIEKKLSGLEGIKKVKSVSSEGLSSINIEFTTDIDIDDALIKVKDKVDLAKPDLPTDLEDDPSVFEVNFSEMPILVLSLSSNMGIRRLTKLAEDLEEDIEGVRGVLDVEIAGNITREIQIQVDPQRMALYAIPFTALQSVVSGENANVSGGSIRTGEGRFQLRVPGEFKTAKEVESIVIAMSNGSPVYLRDVAKVVDGFEDRESYSRTNGRDSITLYIKKRTGENVVQIVDKVMTVVQDSKKAWPPGTTITTVMDEAKRIRNMVADLENNILTGLLLVIIVVMCAMGFRNAVLVSLSIPLSMLMTFIVLQFLGITLNMVVLFSLTLALGMLVDNAIVITENIYRFIQQGVPRLEAAMRATAEVAWPIIGSALTTIFAFVPLLAWDGIMGGFMIYLPKTVIITLSSCLFVALVINPALAAVLLKADSGGKEATADEVMAGGEHPMLDGGGLFLTFYRATLRKALNYRLAVVAFAATMLVIMVMVWFFRVGLYTPMELFPSPDPSNGYISIKPPQGADLDRTDQIVREAAVRVFDKNACVPDAKGNLPLYDECIKGEPTVTPVSKEEYEKISFLPAVKYIYEKSTTDRTAAVFGSASSNQVGIQFVDLADREDSEGNRIASKEVLNQVETLVKNIPGAEITVESEQRGPPTGAPINIEISGDDFNVLGALAEKAKTLVERVPHARNIKSDFEQGSPTLEIRVDRKRAALLGLSTQMIGSALKSAINGTDISTFREKDDDYDITVRFLDKDRRKLDILRQIFIPSPTNGLVPLTTVANIQYTGGVGQITRIDYKRVVTVTADIDETKTTGDTARGFAEKLMEGSFAFAHSDMLKPATLAKELSNAINKGTDINIADEKDKAAVLSALSDIAKEGDKPSNGSKAALAELLNKAMDKPHMFTDKAIKLAASNENFSGLELDTPEKLPKKSLQRLNRILIETAFPGTVRECPPAVTMPVGYSYEFTGENENQKESQEFLSWAMGLALLLIVFILIAQFNSITKPLIIMSAVLLSFGGVFLGLALHNMPFGIIMTGVGVISLAGVVVNNAIVLVDYTHQLIERGMPRDNAIIAAGATRLRPVLLTAITTILGLIPMVTGVSLDFQPMKHGHLPQIQWVSESSQWWASMAVAVIWGLALATMLTLVVVPVLYSLVDSVVIAFAHVFGAARWLVFAIIYEWWNHFDKKHGTVYARRWALEYSKALKEYEPEETPEDET